MQSSLHSSSPKPASVGRNDRQSDEPIVIANENTYLLYKHTIRTTIHLIVSQAPPHIVSSKHISPNWLLTFQHPSIQPISQNWSSSTIFNIIAERQQQFNENDLWESREKDPGSEGWALTAGQSKENESTESSTETEPTMLPGALVAMRTFYVGNHKCRE